MHRILEQELLAASPRYGCDSVPLKEVPEAPDSPLLGASGLHLPHRMHRMMDVGFLARLCAVF